MAMMAFALAALAKYFSSIAGAIVIVIKDRTKERRAMAIHFIFTVLLSFILYYSNAVTERDDDNCVNIVFWTATVGIVSAIWMREGLKALNHEAMAVPGNMWLALYECGEEWSNGLGAEDHDVVSAVCRSGGNEVQELGSAKELWVLLG